MANTPPTGIAAGPPLLRRFTFGRHERHDGSVSVFAGTDGNLTCCRFVGCRANSCPSSSRRPHRTLSPVGAARKIVDVPGRSTDPKVVALKIAELHGRYNIRAQHSIAGGSKTSNASLSAIGCNVELVPFGQGFKDQEPAVDVLERQLTRANCVMVGTRC